MKGDVISQKTKEKFLVKSLCRKKITTPDFESDEDSDLEIERYEQMWDNSKKRVHIGVIDDEPV